MSKPFAMRFNDNDKELIEYFEQVGFTQGVRDLFAFYKSHQEVRSIENVIDSKLKNFLDNFKGNVVISTTTQTEDKRDMSSKSKQFMNNLKAK